jgi:hypothetical protein
MGPFGLPLHVQCFTLCSFALGALNAPHPLLLLAKVRTFGAGRPIFWPKFFELFCEVLVNAEFQKINVFYFEIKHARQR